MTRQVRHINFLDDLRGIAIIGVFVFHALGASFEYDRLPWAGWHRGHLADASYWLLLPMTYGWAGVSMFFVVSGFCIHLSFARRPQWQDFWIRRFFRIYPTYFAALAMFSFLFPFSRLDMSSWHNWVQFAAHAALVHNFGNSTLYGVNGAFWSIAVEVQLYLLFPVLLASVKRVGWKRALWLTALIEGTLRAISYNYIPNSGSDSQTVPAILAGSPFFFWFSWSLGAYIAEDYVHERISPLARLPVIPVALAAFSFDLVKPLSVFSFVLFAVLTATVISRRLAASNGNEYLPGLLGKLLAQTGQWSYSIYLLHVPILLWIAELAKPLLPNPIVVFCLLLCSWVVLMPLSGLWYYVFELRSIDLGKFILASSKRLNVARVERSRA